MTEYILKALSSVSGMKALLLDQETASMTALVLSQTDVINREVFLTDRIDLMKDDSASSSSARLNARGEIENGSSDSVGESFHHLKAVAFIRPTASSVSKLKSVMRSNRFKDYYVFFSNLTQDELVRSLAEGDELELVRQVSEVYADYYALHDYTFHAGCPFSKSLYQIPNYFGAEEKRMLDRNIEAIVSVLLSFKVRADIRYAAGSELAKMVALDVARRQKDESDLFTFQTQTPLLIVMDRVDDPVTPLLSQWTYQAMVHELLGINNNRVSLEHAPGVHKDLKEVVLNPSQDHFYRGSMYLNYGDLGTSIKELCQNFQRKKQTHAKMESIEDMQRFVDNYPEFKQSSGTVSKHMTIMSEMSRLVETRQLMRVSELEQELACENNHSQAMDMLLQNLEDSRIDFDDKIRLVCLYALRYEQGKNQLPVLKKLLRDKAGMDSTLLQKIKVVDALLKHAGSARRGGDLFGNKTLLSAVSRFVKSGLKGVENIYTQHKPLLSETLALIAGNKLKTTAYPYSDSATANAAAKSGAMTKYRLVIVYMVGGFTYEEALACENFNATNSGVRVVLGGSTVLNSKGFIADLMQGVPNYEEHSIGVREQ